MENKTTKSITWAELKEFCENLSEEQLKRPVIYWTEDQGGRIAYAFALEEDYYKNPEDENEGCIPETEYKEMYPEHDLSEMEIAYQKGTPLLQTDF